MRLWMLVLFVTSTGATAAAQCPIQPRLASFDTTERDVTIHYYNSGTRVVRDVHFVVTSNETSQSSQSIVANFTARGILSPKQARVAVFPKMSGFPNLTNLQAKGSLEVEVWDVSFDDASTWRATRRNLCRISLSQR